MRRDEGYFMSARNLGQYFTEIKMMCSIAFCNFSISPERSDFRYYEMILKPLHIFVNIYISFSS